mmetsp:Transcript_14457/g.25997  ORF Transcript_14457/g.25997 Transcript_14457/m.25997 type:complete len:127 (-) Transcript_14457:328-708(-)
MSSLSEERKSYKELSSFSQRAKESRIIRKKYPGRIPVICERDARSSGSIMQIDKVKFLVPSDLTVGQFQFVIRKRLQITPETAMFLFANGRPAPGSATMSMMYEESKDEDGFLYMVYAGEDPFGFA